MRTISIALALALFAATAVRAAEEPAAPPPANVTLTLTAEEAKTWTLVVDVMDQCVARLQLRGDPGQCRGLATFLASFAEKVSQAATPKK